MESKIHHLAFVSAREYAKDGYHLVDFGFDEKQASTRYNLIHDNGNRLSVVATEYDNSIRVFKNNKLNKTIKL